LCERVAVHVEDNSLIFLAFVTPLAVYCLVLFVINRRRHAVLVSGPWDFAGVLFAASGFLLLGGPAILTGIYEQWRLSWLLGQPRYLRGIGENWSFWISLWSLYFVMVGGVSAVVLWRRRAQTSIYNVEPAVLAEVLPQVLDRLGLEWLHNGPRRVLLRFREPLDDSWTGLTLEPFPTMRHVTLHWQAHDPTLRGDVETELANALAQVPARPNPVAGWFLSLSLGLFFSAFLVLLALLTLRILHLPR
jgi:hypothetical protein